MALPQMLTSSSTAGTAVVAYTVPANMQAAVTINCVGLVRSTINVFIAPSSGTLTDANKIERSLTLDVGQVLERGRIVLPAGHRLLISSDVASAVAVQVWGIEEAA